MRRVMFFDPDTMVFYIACRNGFSTIPQRDLIARNVTSNPVPHLRNFVIYSTPNEVAERMLADSILMGSHVPAEWIK